MVPALASDEVPAGACPFINKNADGHHFPGYATSTFPQRCIAYFSELCGLVHTAVT